jgi:hypothetical protein
MLYRKSCTPGHPVLPSDELINRKKFIDPDNLKNLQAMSVANVSAAQSANVTKVRTGDLYRRGQIAYLQSHHRMAKELMEEDDLLEGDVGRSSSDNMLEYLRKIGAWYVCLLHRKDSTELRRKQQKKTTALKGGVEQDEVGPGTLISEMTTSDSTE